MFCIGEVDDVSKKLVEDTLKAVQLGLSEVRPFNRLGNVGAVINEFAQSQGYKVVRDIGGHGVGLEFHEDPFVSYVTRRDTGMLLVPGMVFTIEPMINLEPMKSSSTPTTTGLSTPKTAHRQPSGRLRLR